MLEVRIGSGESDQFQYCISSLVPDWIAVRLPFLWAFATWQMGSKFPVVSRRIINYWELTVTVGHG